MRIDKQYPGFVLAFCVFQKQVYGSTVIPTIRQVKFETFGHDMVILHENDIRKKGGPLSKLGKHAREQFLETLTNVIRKICFELIAVVSDKRKLAGRYQAPSHPYHFALGFGLKRVHRLVRDRGQDDATTHIVREARGRQKDAAFELEFRRICGGENYFTERLPFELVVADKKVNRDGMQLADLTARPIGLHVLKPHQRNRAFEVLRNNLYTDWTGNMQGVGLKVFP